MLYLVEKKKRNSKLKRNLKAARREGAISFDQSYKLSRQPEDKLKVRADRKAKARRDVSTVDRMRAQKKFGGGRLHMTTPKAREMEKKFHSESIYVDGSVFAPDLLALEEEIYGPGWLDR